MALLASGALAAQEFPQEPAQSTPATAPPVDQVTVHGVVRNAATGDPLPRALVRIEGDADAGALTDGDGRFEIPGVPSGQQIFQVIKPGFGDPAPPGELSVDGSGGATHNIVVAASMPELAFALEPRCSLRGRVELSTGDPAQGIVIEVLRQTVQQGRTAWQTASTARTNSEGTWRVGNLADGKYAVMTNPAMDSDSDMYLVEPGHGAQIARNGYASIFYPDARDLAGAAKIRLSNGEQAQANLMLTLEPFHTVSAKVLDPRGRANAPGSPSDRPAESYSAQVLDIASHQTAYTAQYDQATHSIQATLPNGTYSLTVTEAPVWNGQAGLGNADLQPPAPLTGSADFSVEGHAVSNVRVPLSNPHGSSVQLRINRTALPSGQAGAALYEGIVVTASQAGGLFSGGAVNMFAQGSEPGPMKTSSMPPGSYWVHTQVARRDLCEESFTAGGVNLAREPLVLGLSGATAPLELTLRDDCAKLTLSLAAPFSGLVPGEEPFETVYVVPDFDSTVDVQPFVLRPSSGGTITLEGLTPGSYHVYAFNQPVQLEYHNPAVLAALPNPGQQVTLSPGATSSLALAATAP